MRRKCKTRPLREGVWECQDSKGKCAHQALLCKLPRAHPKNRKWKHPLPCAVVIPTPSGPERWNPLGVIIYYLIIDVHRVSCECQDTSRNLEQQIKKRCVRLLPVPHMEAILCSSLNCRCQLVQMYNAFYMLPHKMLNCLIAALLHQPVMESDYVPQKLLFICNIISV